MDIDSYGRIYKIEEMGYILSGLPSPEISVCYAASVSSYVHDKTENNIASS
ncbi:hypothetical protein [Cuniculiplasma divulgatum]|uniref:Uncharacterized protein n=1 Tax=Cuniculiplasma divulgatum TaxID=1673428 RepID=A0A1N5WQA4_9ARCH|nr:hypothetical protein [Cuniculiplasma divulgatum]MCL4319886.1 hypothetical protein [Candidatus Thermoplasmatota archaeon]MCL5788016.1 hypothetical protein [Candidatus Thermoplasmatota archaeon]WMT50039.1 MAG: hypothetical protein RE472_03485 [Thermoplasmatales archaeon]SIM86875.1 hypothetical protein CSP5_1919 [Cuniculiplasma divulgatum]